MVLLDIIMCVAALKEVIKFNPYAKVIILFYNGSGIIAIGTLGFMVNPNYDGLKKLWKSLITLRINLLLDWSEGRMQKYGSCIYCGKIAQLINVYVIIVLVKKRII